MPHGSQAPVQAYLLRRAVHLFAALVANIEIESLPVCTSISKARHPSGKQHFINTASSPGVQGSLVYSVARGLVHRPIYGSPSRSLLAYADLPRRLLRNNPLPSPPSRRITPSYFYTIHRHAKCPQPVLSYMHQEILLYVWGTMLRDTAKLLLRLGTWLQDRLARCFRIRQNECITY